jgi:type I restriction enzyme S subunit
MKTDIQKYPAYKHSGAEWIEDVPSHWEVKKFKRVFYEIKKRSNPELNCGSISFGKVVYKDDEKIPESTKKSYQVVMSGDFLVNPLNLNYDLISLRIALSDIVVVVSSGYIVLSNSVKLDKTFYKYFLHRFDVAFMKLLGSGVRQTLNWNDIANCDLIFPPIHEQTAIAVFLDHKTALIDQAIGIKQKQIELLKERRQILIHKAVTRGLNPNVKLKDSGVEWIGEIPEGWEVKRLKMLAENIISGPFGSSLIKDEYVKSGYKIYGQEQVIPNDFNIGDYYISEAKFKRMLRYEISVGDILISCVGTFGKIALVPDKFEKGIINPRLIKLNPKRNLITPEYVQEALLSPYCFKQFELVSRGGTMGVINIELLSRLVIMLPPIKEQIAILKFLEQWKSKIATAISFKEQEIEKLKEYKATLINSAVTGKIKVC